MENTLEFIKTFLHPQSIIQYGGLALLLFIIFAETGLFFGFFLPGDSLLFVAGLMSGSTLFDVDIVTLNLSIIVAGILGNFVGYYFGKKTGPVLFKRDDSLFFKKKHANAAKSFYDRYGGMALILGRFIPIIRTFVPIMAGVVSIDFKKFVLYNIVGCVAWVVSMTLSGYFLGRMFPSLQENLEYIVIIIIAVSMIPVVITYLKERNRAKNDIA
ncbi:MAG: DedA family protein [bacterium]|jgi:membrane-associated protein